MDGGAGREKRDIELSAPSDAGACAGICHGMVVGTSEDGIGGG